MYFVTRTLESLKHHWAKGIDYDVCFPCPGAKCGKKKLFKECFNESIESVQCGLHAITTASIKSKYGLVQEGVDSCIESSMLSSRSKLRVEEARSSPEDMDTQDAPITTSGNVNFPQEAGYMSDIYLVSSSKNTPYVEKMMRIIKDNNWTLTTPFTSRLGEPEMQSAEEAVKNCLYIVLIITKEDCEKRNGKYNMIIEMAFKYMEKSNRQGRVIPILCCSKESLPLRLASLTDVGIDDVNLEERLKDAVGITIKEQREVQGCLVSGLVTDGVDLGSEIPMISTRSITTESNILCDSYLSDLAEQIGSEWPRVGIRLGLNQADIDHIEEDKPKAVDRILAMLQLWRQRSSSGVDRRKMIEKLCNALSSCSRTDLAEEIREAAGIS